MWRLIINGPGYFDTPFDLPEGATALGRSEENDIVLSGDLVSRRHARFLLEKGRLSIVDTGSRNGSKLNGAPLSASSELTVGDVVTLGENTITVRRSADEGNTAEILDTGGTPLRLVSNEKMGAVLLARDVRESFVARALDNAPNSLTPFEVDEEAAAASQSALPPSEALRVLCMVAERMSQSATQEAFLADAVDRLLERIGATTVALLLRNESGALAPAVVRHKSRLEKGELPVSDAIIDEALKSGSAMVIRNARDDRRFSGRESVVTYGAEQIVCVPLGPKAPFRGVLYLNTRPHSPKDLEALVELCVAFGRLVVGAVDGVQARGTGEERLRRALSRSLPAAFVDRRVAEVRGGASPLGISTGNATVLVMEVLPSLDDAGKAGPLLETFHQRVAPLIFAYEGTLESSRGTGIRAVFGAPYGKDDDTRRAVRAAFALRSEWTRACLSASLLIPLRIGIASGETLSGLVGSVRHDFVVCGEAALRADALLNAAEPGETLLDEATVKALGGADKYVESLGALTLASLGISENAFRLRQIEVAGSTQPGVVASR